MNSLRRSLPVAASLLLVLSAIAGCGAKGPAGPPGAGMPPPEVAIVTIAPKNLAITTELPGRLEASRIAQVRARAAGIVLKREFREGGDVKAGEVLFRIDPAPFQATYESAEASVAKSEANLAQATLKVQRYKPLVETSAISKQEYDDAVTAQKQTAADLATAKATRQTAELNLGYATVVSPITGRIGRAQVTEGALVGQGEATPLATVQQLDPIYVNLTQSSVEVARMRQAMSSGKLQSAGKGQLKVNLVTEDGQVYPSTGKLLFADMTVDENTGAILLRAEFPNPGHVLLPGMYVRARFDQAIKNQAITVPQQAILRGSDGASVMVVDAEGKVSVRPIKTGDMQDNDWIVTDGLKSGDRVIVEGLQKVKPGATVKAVPWSPAPADQKQKQA